MYGQKARMKMGMIVEEIGRYDTYTDNFIKNTTADRIEVGTDGNHYRLSISNGNEFLSKDKLYTKSDVVAMLDKIKAEIEEEKEHAYADFERYKVDYLGQEWEDALDSLPIDDFRYGMERAIEIIDKYKAESEDNE